MINGYDLAQYSAEQTSKQHTYVHCTQHICKCVFRGYVFSRFFDDYLFIF